jgi:hypothetical protein
MKPEYYKFIKETTIKSFTQYKIYKIKNPDNLNHYENFINDERRANGLSPENDKCFEPATKEEYLIQEGIIPKQKQNYDYLVEFFTKYNIK